MCQESIQIQIVRGLRRSLRLGQSFGEQELENAER
jgi:hypothetical protein